jgi:1-deoxy-D-xylulose-5-phosphate reductoisomerase
MKRVAILGSTGSIGLNALDVMDHLEDFEVALLCARNSWETVDSQIDRYSPAYAICTNGQANRHLAGTARNGTKVLETEEALLDVLAGPDIDIVMSGISGAAGLAASFATVESGKILALANKESIVMAGPLLVAMAARTGARILPVDSEHSAIFQALGSRPISEISRIILTASGGPFRTRKSLADVTPEEASRHPNWDMGTKITVDSASMFNKALEIIEARWLFGVETERIEVVVHPQSIVHSMVEFNDGSIIAQMGPPDMRVPIQFALTYPEHLDGPAPRLDIANPFRLDFEPPDMEKFPAVRLGFEAAAVGGTMGAVLNAANEVAVERFLNGDITFPDIWGLVEGAMNTHDLVEDPTLPDILAADEWARAYVR